jgi:hypothetical protein
MYQPFPQRPKGMHWRAHHELRRQYDMSMQIHGRVGWDVKVLLASRPEPMLITLNWLGFTTTTRLALSIPAF